MSRQVKVRAWDRAKKCWLTGENKHLCISGDIGVYVEYRQIGATWEPVVVKQLTWVEMHNLVTEQLTGIKDKYGRDIYEGDIVTVRAEGSVWNRDVEIPDIYDMDYQGDWTMELIGNIHENPERL